VYAVAFPKASVIVPFNTGFGMLAGQAVSGHACGGTNVIAQIRGYYFTIP